MKLGKLKFGTGEKYFLECNVTEFFTLKRIIEKTCNTGMPRPRIM